MFDFAAAFLVPLTPRQPGRGNSVDFDRLVALRAVSLVQIGCTHVAQVARARSDMRPLLAFCPPGGLYSRGRAESSWQPSDSLRVVSRRGKILSSKPLVPWDGDDGGDGAGDRTAFGPDSLVELSTLALWGGPVMPQLTGFGFTGKM